MWPGGPTQHFPIPVHRPSPLALREPPQEGPWRERRPTQRQSVQNARTYRPPQKVPLLAQRWSETVVRCLAVVERHPGSRVIRAYTKTLNEVFRPCQFRERLTGPSLVHKRTIQPGLTWVNESGRRPLLQSHLSGAHPGVRAPHAALPDNPSPQPKPLRTAGFFLG